MSIIEKAIDRLVDDKGPVRREKSADVPVTRADFQAPVGGESAADGGNDQRMGASPPSEASSEKVVSVAPGSANWREPREQAGTFGDDLEASEKEGVGATALEGVRIYGLELEGLISPQTERSRTAEEFRIIKRPLLQRAFAGASPAGEHQNVLVVTSSVAGEGKTFTSLNLAISIAMELDRTVLLVDADLANPGLSRRLNVKDRPGLIERLLDDQRDLKDLLLKTDVPKLTLLPAGRQHRRSTELLASNTMKGLLDELATRYPDRVVIFDSPPLLATSEASVLANQAGQIVLVIESGTTPQFLVKEAVGVLQNHDRISLVLNKSKRDLLSARGGYYYGYKYGYGYGYGKDNART